MDAPFDQTTLGLRERPMSGDFNRNYSQVYRTLREVARFALAPRTSFSSAASASVGGFYGDGLRVVPASPVAMSVSVSAGVGYLYDAVDLQTNIGATDLENMNDLSPYKPMPLMAPQTFAVPAAPGSPNSRIDIIEMRCDRRLEDATTRKQLDIGTLSFADNLFYKTLAYALDGQAGVVTNPSPSTAGLSYKIGTAANPGLVPPTTAGYMKIAEIVVPTGTTSISLINIIDRRALLFPGGVCHVSARWRCQSAGPVMTPLQISAPPGIQIGIRQNSIGGDMIFAIAGGEIKTATVTPAWSPNTSLLSGAEYITGFVQLESGLNGAPVTIASGHQSFLQTMTPPVLVGNGTRAVFGQIRSRYQLDGVTNNSDAILQDFYMAISAGLSWQA